MHPFTIVWKAVHCFKAPFTRRAFDLTLAAVACSFLINGAANAQTARSAGFLTVGGGFNGPFVMAPDSNGNVYVADRGSNAIKEIVAVDGRVSDTSNVVTLVTGLAGPAGVAVDSKNDVFFADTGNSLIKEIIASNGVVSASSTIVTVGSGFNNPYGLAVDSNGNVFVADAINNAVKEIVAVNGVVSSSSTVNIVGSGFNSPHGVGVDGRGNVFVADQGNHAIKEILAVNGAVTSSSTVNVVGGGFFYPTDVAVDARGNVFVADLANHAVKEVIAVNGAVSASSNISYVPGFFYLPTGVTVDANGNLFVADVATNRVTENIGPPWPFPAAPVGSTSGSVPVFFTFDGGGTLSSTPYLALTQGNLNGDFQAAATQDANACVTGRFYNGGDGCTVEVTFTPTKPGTRVGAVQLFGANGMAIATGNLYGTGTGPMVTFSPPIKQVVGSGFTNPISVALDGSGNVFVTTPTSSAVFEVVAVNGAVSSTSAVVTVGSGFNNPYGLAADGSGNIFVADTGNSALKEIVAVNGAVSSISTVSMVNSSFGSPTGVAIDKSGDVLVADAGTGTVYEVVAVDGVVSSSSPVNTIASGFSSPRSVALDASGNVYVADFGNNAAKQIGAINGVVSPNSTVIAVGTGFTTPTGVAVTGDGSVVVADYGNNALKEIVAVNGVVSSSSTVETLASGLTSPDGVAVDGSGNVIVAETNQDQVSKLDVATAPVLSFATTEVGFTSPDSPQTVTITNRGNAVLTFEIPSAGQNPSISTNFTLDNSSTCPVLNTSSSAATLAAGASCTEVINFIPTTSGNLSGSLGITNDNLNAPSPTFLAQSVGLNGTGTVAPAVKVATNTIPATVVSGSNLGTVTATIQGVNGNTITGSSAAVTVTITGPGGYSHTVMGTAVNGIASFDLSSLHLTTPGTYTTSTDSPGLTGTSSTTTVTAGAAVAVTTNTIPATVFSGDSLGTVVATIKDANGNTVTNSSAAITATITGPNGYSQHVTANATGGTALFDLASLTFSTAGSYTITTTSSGLTQALASFTVAVNTTQAAKLALSTIPSPVDTGGNLGTVLVSVETSVGSVVTSSTASITVTIAGPLGYSQQVVATAVNGIANFSLSSLTFSTAGSYTITATTTGLAQASGSYIVMPSATRPAKLALPAIPATIAVGANLSSVSVSVETNSGSVVTTSTALLTLSITFPDLSSQVFTIRAVNGIATFSLGNLGLSQSGIYVITATSTGLTEAIDTFTATSSITNPAKLALGTIPATVDVGASLGAVPVSIETSSGAAVTSSSAIVTVTITGPNGYSQATMTPAVNGIATFNLSSLTFSSAGSHTIAATSIGLTPALASFTVTSGYNVNAPQTPLTVGQGGTVVVNITVPSLGGAFNNAVTMSATGIPLGATATFDPPIVTPGAAGAATVLTIQLLTVTAANLPVAAQMRMTVLPLGTTLAACCALFFYRRSTKLVIKHVLVSASFLFVIALATLLSACNGGFAAKPGTISGNYAVTITGTSGSLHPSTTVNITVQ